MPEWYESLPAEDLAAATNNGWNKPANEIVGAIFKSQREGHSRMGSMLPMPASATDPVYQSVYDRVVGLALPKTPDEYKFDGIKIGDADLAAEDQAFMRGLASELKLTPTQARGLVERMAAHDTAQLTAETTNSATAKQANDTALRSSWGQNYDTQAAGAATVLDALKAVGIPVSFDGLDAAGHVAAMTGLFNLSQQLKEHPMLRGGGNPAPAMAMTPQAAQARLDELKGNAEWFNKAWSQPGSAEQTEFHNLQAYIAGVTPEEAAAFRAGGRIERR